MAIMLMLHNRIDASEPASGLSQTAKYNRILSEYITQSHGSTVLHEPHKLESIPFYIGLLIGERAQRTAFAKIMIQMKDEGIMSSIHNHNKRIFTEQMCQKLLKCVPRLAIYNGEARQYDNDRWYTLRDDIEAQLESKEEHSVIEQLLWLKRQDDLSVTVEYYVELARKLLADMHLGSVRYLLSEFMLSNLSQRERQMVTAEQAEARLPIVEEPGIQAHVFE